MFSADNILCILYDGSSRSVAAAEMLTSLRPAATRVLGTTPRSDTTLRADFDHRTQPVETTPLQIIITRQLRGSPIALILVPALTFCLMAPLRQLHPESAGR